MRSAKQFWWLGALLILLVLWYAEYRERRTAFAESMARALNGDTLGQIQVAHMYRRGDGVRRNASEAIRWFRKAAENGDDDAAYELGVMYGGEKGVQPDYAESVKWYRRAADKDNGLALFALGRLYRQGEGGVDKDYAQAIELFRKAALGGFPPGVRSMVGEMYRDGMGVETNYVEAYAYFSVEYQLPKVGKRKPWPAGKESRDALEMVMTQQQISEAQKRTKELRGEIEARRKARRAQGN